MGLVGLRFGGIACPGLLLALAQVGPQRRCLPCLSCLLVGQRPIRERGTGLVGCGAWRWVFLHGSNNCPPRRRVKPRKSRWGACVQAGEEAIPRRPMAPGAAVAQW